MNNTDWSKPFSKGMCVRERERGGGERWETHTHTPSLRNAKEISAFGNVEKRICVFRYLGNEENQIIRQCASGDAPAPASPAGSVGSLSV